MKISGTMQPGPWQETFHNVRKPGTTKTGTTFFECDQAKNNLARNEHWYRMLLIHEKDKNH
jgi:hypothetical protein